ncbi:PAS domain S-box protein [Paenibacillus sp. PL2-23]|uniref:PAS domain S-box protein n=1 Tax=Paenibacillus sp. PL2-23 TaxID=2100729 RepID=UPI0030FB902E
MPLIQDSLFTIAFQSSPIGMALADLDGRWLQVNPAFCDMLGYAEEELLAFSFHMDSSLQEQQRSLERINQMIAGELSVCRLEKGYLHRKGHIVWVQLSLTIVRDEQSRPLYFIAHIQDVSAQMIAAYSTDIISYAAPDGSLQYVSPSIKTVLGLEPEEMIGQNSLSFIHPEDAAALQSVYERDSSEEAFIMTYRSRHADGHYVWLETTVRTIRDKTGVTEKIIGIARDITERKHAEQLMHDSEKLTLAGQLAAGIAHEIRNPLTAIKGFFQLLQSGKMKRDYYQVIQEEFLRIELIINELLVLAKPQAVSCDRYDIVALLDDVTKLLEPQAILNNIQLQRRFEEAAFHIECDGNQMKQVFINVLKNAMEAMPDGGDIVISLKPVGNLLQIIVQDQGCGIAKEAVKRIGQPFFSSKEAGTGLGMMVSFKIIEEHGGSMHIESELGQGTSVAILLPMPSRI